MEAQPVLRQRVTERSVFVDIGVAEGAETIAAALSGYVVYGFEPRLDSIHAVAKKLKERGLQFEVVKVSDNTFSREAGKPWPPLTTSDPTSQTAGHVYLIHAAVSNVNGFLDLGVGDMGEAASAVDPGSAAVKQRVAAVTLDHALDHESVIHVLKSDTQGFEVNVMSGGKQSHRKARLVIYELWPKGLAFAEASVKDFFRELADAGFVICYDLYEQRPANALESMDAYENFVNSEYLRTKTDRFGFFTDVLCAKSRAADSAWKLV